MLMDPVHIYAAIALPTLSFVDIEYVFIVLKTIYICNIFKFICIHKEETKEMVMQTVPA